jgi:uncharacterized membrane protein YbhN (UPF0104 family)
VTEGYRLLNILRPAFLVAVVVFAWLGLRGRLDEVGDALRDTSLFGIVAALTLVLLGLGATGLLWLRLMSRLGARLPTHDGLATFFVGQLGKYIPGSVWSIGAQAQMAGRHAVPARATVAAGLLFLGYHVATAVVVGSVTALSGSLDPPWPAWVSVLVLVVSLVGLLPPVVSRLGRRVAGREVAIGLVDTMVVGVLMAAAWTSYAVALVLLSPGLPWWEVAAFGGAFALAYAVGVIVVVAPAGVGAREALFVMLLAPVTSVAAATALALLARVVHTAADAVMAAGWWYAARGRRGSDPEQLELVAGTEAHDRAGGAPGESNPQLRQGPTTELVEPRGLEP